MATTAVNGPMVHDSEATAYEMPNTNIDHRPRVRPPLSRRGSESAGSHPAKKAPPITSRAMPMITVSHGENSPTATEVQDTRAPATANSSRNPADTTVPTSKARDTEALEAPSSPWSMPRK